MIDISSDLKKAFEALTQTEDFLSHLSSYTRAAFQLLYSLPASSTQVDIPPTYLFILSHIISNNQSFDYVMQCLPESAQDQFVKICKQYVIGRKDELNGNLCDAKWKMYIENGRQIWQIELFTQESPLPFVMKLNYEQLSILTFKVNQVMAHVGSIDIEKVAK